MTSMSGIAVDPAVTALFNEIKLRSTHKWATFKIVDKKNVEVDEKGDRCITETPEEDKAQFDILMSKMTKEPRYCLYDFGFTNKEGRKINKLAFIFWSPDDGLTKDKMIYASTKDTAKKAFSGLSLEFQITDDSEKEYGPIQAEVEKKA